MNKVFWIGLIAVVAHLAALATSAVLCYLYYRNTIEGNVNDKLMDMRLNEESGHQRIMEQKQNDLSDQLKIMELKLDCLGNGEIYSEDGETCLSKEKTCLDNGGNYYKEGRICYKLFSSSKTWNAAREYCQDNIQVGFRNGDLAAVSNWKIKQTLEKGLTKERSSLWIGGNKVDGQWQWSNGDTWEFENWASGQPNPDASKEENFIRMYADNTWHDYDINANSHFLCEWKM